MSEGEKVLNEMKLKAERAWQLLINETQESEKEKLREDYRQALDLYKKQLVLFEGIRESKETYSRSEKKFKVKHVTLNQQRENHPNPFEYHDYREFLLDWLRYLKAFKNESVIEFSQRVGIALKTLLRVFKRWQKISAEDYDAIINELGLSPTENEFLEALRHLSDTDSRAVRFSSLRRIQSFSQYQRIHPKEYEAWRYLSHWYYVAIREMSTLGGFIPDSKWIQERLRYPVSIEDIENALEFLKGAGFFKINDSGKVESSLKQVSCAGGIYRLALTHYHWEILELAQSAIEKVPSEKRFLSGYTFAISKENYEQVRSILEEALEKIRQLDPSEKSSDDVYHIEVLAIPMTQKVL